MKGNESPSNGVMTAPAALDSIVRRRQHRPAKYQKVKDERKHAIRGLWVRNGRYYAQITLEDPKTGQKKVRRIPLENASTAAQAKAALDELSVQRRKGHAIVQRQAPQFASFAQDYLTFHREAKDAKRASTMETERHAINRLCEQFGKLHLNKIKRVHIGDYIAKRQADGKSARTVNLEITVLRNVLNRAIDLEFLAELPTGNLRPLKSIKRKRQLTPVTDIEKLCSVVVEPVFLHGRLAKDGEKGVPLLNAQQFVDYIRFMCYCGARMSEALQVRWADVDWVKCQLTIGADGETKNRQCRVVDFNQKLESHLKDMHAHRVPGSAWLFPSPRSGETDRPAKTFRESLLLARTAARMPKFGFHDCRHFFISFCVMAGIDYMTIARWVGHQDGGILIGRVYGHLSDEHAKLQAKKLSF